MSSLEQRRSSKAAKNIKIDLSGRRASKSASLAS